MKITQFSLEHFTAFAEPTQFNFNPGINVLIGTHSTGKTHLMKAMYAMLKVCETAHRDQIENPDKLALIAEENLMGVFKPNKIGRLVRHQVGNNNGKIAMTYAERHIAIQLTTRNNVTVEYDQIPVIKEPQYTAG